MRIRPIKTQHDFEMALSLIDKLWNAEYGSSEYDDFETLAICIESYEREKNSLEFADPIEAIRYYMQQKEKTFDDLSELLGCCKIAFQILYREIALTTDMIWALCKNWGIPAECLIKPYSLNLANTNTLTKLKGNEEPLTSSLSDVAVPLNFPKTVGHS